MLPLPWSFVPPLEPVLDLPQAALARKDELHLTLLSADEAARAAATTPEAEWRAYFDRHDWSLRLTDRWVLLQDRDAGTGVRSVIAEVECPSLNRFRRDLAHAAATDIPETLPHVTLWVAGDARGIGVASMAEFGRKKVRALTAREREQGIATS